MEGYFFQIGTIFERTGDWALSCINASRKLFEDVRASERKNLLDPSAILKAV